MAAIIMERTAFGDEEFWSRMESEMRIAEVDEIGLEIEAARDSTARLELAGAELEAEMDEAQRCLDLVTGLGDVAIGKRVFEPLFTPWDTDRTTERFDHWAPLDHVN